MNQGLVWNLVFAQLVNKFPVFCRIISSLPSSQQPTDVSHTVPNKRTQLTFIITHQLPPHFPNVIRPGFYFIYTLACTVAKCYNEAFILLGCDKMWFQKFRITILPPSSE
jgi:hypothetical protein